MHAFENERVSQDEANRVVELWAQRQRERERLNEMPTVAGLAEALGTSQEEVAALLHQVREPKQTQKVRPDKSFLISGAIALGLGFLMLCFLMTVVVVEDSRAATASYAPPPLPGQPLPTVWVEAPPAPPTVIITEG